MQTTAPAPQGVPTTTVDRVAGVLRRAAVALNSRLSLGDVLDLFTHEILAHTDAQRASLLLCRTVGDPSGHRVELHPAASAARTDDPALMQAFRSHAVLTLNARQRLAFERARAIQVPRAGGSSLVPDEWVHQFDLASVVLVPLFADGRPCGLLAADYTPRDAFDPEEVDLLEALAEVAGVAIRNAHLYEAAGERARLRGVLSDATAALAAPLEREVIAHRLAEAMQALLHAEVAMVGFLDRDGWLRPLAITDDRPLPESRPLARVPARIVRPVDAVWRHGVTRACELPDDPWLRGLVDDEDPHVDRFVLLPLLADGIPAGAVLAGLRGRSPLDADARTSAEALASIGGTALERRALLRHHERQVRRLREDLWLAAIELGPTAARDLPATLHRMRDVLGDLPDLSVEVEVAGLRVSLPAPAQQALYRVVRRVLAGVQRVLARDGGPGVHAAVRVRLEVGRREARLSLVVTDDGCARPDLDEVRSQLEAAGGGLDAERRTTGRLVVEAWLPRHPAPTGQPGGRHTPSEHLPYGLTPRERDVLEMLAQAMTNPQIAERLEIAVTTVKTHVRRLVRKLDVADRREAGRVAVAEGLVATPALYPTVAQMSSQQDDDRDRPDRQGEHDHSGHGEGVTTKTIQRLRGGGTPEPHEPTQGRIQ